MPASDPHPERRPRLLRRHAPLPAVVGPLERFLRAESGSASLLLGAALAALVWINLAAESYEDFWSTALTIELGSLHLEEDLRALVNELLMAVFFYVVALEVKRETLYGSLREPRSAAVPVAAALGTMVGGAAVYVLVNLDGGELRGWAVPIATDIAFALGVLGVAGRRAPRPLRAFLLTLAVVDDLGTIIIIAVFFTEGIAFAWLAVAGVLVVAVVVLQRLAIRSVAVYTAFAGLLWLATLESGVHPTIAGVIVGFLTPAAAIHSRDTVSARIRDDLSAIAEAPDEEVSESTMGHVQRLAHEAVSPRAVMEERLHPWSSFLILPLFALANAGVGVSPGAIADALTGPVGLGIVLGLVVGAPLGGLLFAWLPVRFGPARLPEELDWPAIGGVAPLKGIGFTVAIFISVLAFDDPALQEEAKLAILVGSAVAGAIGLTVLFMRHRLLGGGDQDSGDADRPNARAG